MMENTDKRVDTYIGNSAPFAKPILLHLRNLIHQAIPGVQETMKWSFPHFDYHGIVCSMAAFKHHCAFTFWKASLLNDPNKLFTDQARDGMGHLGQIRDPSDLPPDEVLIAYLREAANLNASGIKIRRKPNNSDKKDLEIPEYFKEALEANPAALETFMNFSYSHKKEYLEWVGEAKTAATRSKRILTSVEWLAEGKGRNWKYEKK